MSRFPLVTLTPSPAAHAPAKWVITAHQAPRERGRKQKGHFSPRANKQQNTFSAAVFINGLWFKVLKVSCARRHLSCPLRAPGPAVSHRLPKSMTNPRATALTEGFPLSQLTSYFLYP